MAHASSCVAVCDMLELQACPDMLHFLHGMSACNDCLMLYCLLLPYVSSQES